MCVLEGKNARQKLKNENSPEMDRTQRYVIFRRPTLGVKLFLSGGIFFIILICRSIFEAWEIDGQNTAKIRYNVDLVT